MWLHSLKVAQLLRSAACLHTNQSRSYLNHLVHYSVIASRTSDQGWSKGLDASTYSNCHYSLFSNKNPIIRIFCMSEWLAVPINPDKWSTTVLIIVLVAFFFPKLPVTIVYYQVNSSHFTQWFESRRGIGWLSLVSVMCQPEVCASG